MSNQAVKDAILTALQDAPHHTRCTRHELRSRLGLGDVSMTQFWAALRSLHYKPGEQYVKLACPHDMEFGTRLVSVRLLRG